ncbi:MAG: insulinase family protein [Deltaproteobacteria bacterium]|nr:insulinase family protein [Deltaproteobacteria bacterium]
MTLLTLLFATPAAAEVPLAQHTCPNGLTVLVAENHALPLITIEYAAKNGSMTEPPEYNGLSHLYEHMFFKGNAKIPNQEAFMARMRELGMEFNGTTETERVNYFFTSTSDHLNDAMAFMRDAVVSPLFDPKEFERERVVVTGEIDRNESNPYYHFWHTLNPHIWWKYPTRKDPLGSRDTVLHATTDMMRTIQHRYYVPNNSVIVVTGDVKAADVFAQADALYASWPKAADPFVEFPLVTHPPLPASSVVVVEQPVETFIGQFTYHGPSTVGPSVPDTYAADLLSTAISEPSSKFQKDLVDSGACVRVGMSWFTQKNVGPISISFEAAPDKIDACTKAVMDELPKIKSADYLSDEELANAAHTLEVGQAHERESGSGFAHAITFWWSSAGLDYYDGYVANVKKVTRADIARYLDTWILGKPTVFGAMVSPEMTKAGATEPHFAQLLGIPASQGVGPPKTNNAPAEKPTSKKKSKKGSK